MSLIAYKAVYDYFLSLKSRFSGTKPFCRWVRYFWFTQSSLNQKSRVVAVFKCMIIDLAFHVLFKSNPNVITSLFVRSERAMTRLTRWPPPCHGTGPGQKTQVYSGIPSHTVVPATRQRQDKKMDRTLCAPCDTAVLPWVMEQPQILSLLLPQELYKLPGLWLRRF